MFSSLFKVYFSVARPVVASTERERERERERGERGEREREREREREILNEGPFSPENPIKIFNIAFFTLQ